MAKKRRSAQVATRKAYRKAKKAATKAAEREARGAAKKKSKKKATARKKTARRSTRSRAKTSRTSTRKKASPRRSTKPSPVKTGRGLSPAEIGAAVVEAFNEHRPDVDVWDSFWSADVESIEGMGVSQVWRGRDAMEAKGQQWMAEHTVHSASAEGPYVGATGFAIKFRMDVEVKSTGDRVLMEELGVYTVRNGKVMREEFMYGSVTPVVVAGEHEEMETTARFEEEEEIPI